MPQYINTNIPSVIARRHLAETQGEYTNALERLASGLRINSAADDAAGLAISTRFTSQIRGLEVGIRNAQDAVSLAQTAEGALGSVTDSLLRIRDLALQSANATNSDTDREALNAEVQQLLDEIERVTEESTFNETKLLDGTFAEVTFQIGPNEGDRISFGLEGMTIDTLGTGEEDGVSSNQQGSIIEAAAMEAGDLIINGFAVPGSNGADDGFSSADNEKSAIAKAAAINSVTDNTGVVAEVGQTRVSGTTSTFNSGAGGGTIQINGFDVDLPSASNVPASVQMQNVANAINAVSGQTGVVASFSGMPGVTGEKDCPPGELAIMSGTTSTGVTLSAADGRNIIIENGTAIATDYGLAAAKTYVGSYTLISTGGKLLDLDTAGNIANAGIAVGTFSGGNSGVVGQAVTAEPLQTGDLTINGVAIPGTIDAADTTGGGAASAIAKVAAINSVSQQTGVEAKVGSTILVAGSSATFTPGQADGSFLLNGVDISLAHSSADSIPEQVALTIAAINTKSGQTGVVAEGFGDSYRLVAEDGRNIVVQNAGPTPVISLSEIGFSNATVLAGVLQVVQSGPIILEGAGAIEIGSLTGDVGRAGFEIGSYGAVTTGSLVRDIDISTVEGALEAIGSVDNALDRINLNRARIGAIQNRFEETIGNQRIAHENLTESRARIRDADFAEETARLAKEQVLQQAGVSILAQANAQTQNVLQLLQ